MEISELRASYIARRQREAVIIFTGFCLLPLVVVLLWLTTR